MTSSTGILFFGMRGLFSRLALESLLAAGVAVRAVVVPAENVGNAPAPLSRLVRPAAVSRLPLANSFMDSDAVTSAWEREIPVFEAADLAHELTLAALAKYDPFAACVACYSQKIPARLLALPRHGFLNLHPSRLPHYRGPSPLFWLFRQGVQDSAVTVHFMNESLDRGDIVRQADLFLPDGMSGEEADEISANTGGKLLAESLNDLRLGRANRHPQQGEGSYFPWPKEEDFSLDMGWSARRAFNFMRGTANWDQSYTLQIGGETLRLHSAVSFNANKEMSLPFEVTGSQIAVQFRPGVLRATLGRR